MRYGDGRGAEIRALDRKGAVAWSLEAGTADPFAAFSEDALLVGDEGTVRRVDPRNGSVEWTHPGKRLRKFALAGASLFFFAGDPLEEAATRLVALDAVRGTELWSESFQGFPSRLLPAGTGIAFTTASPNRLHLFDQETGKRRLEAPCSAGQSVQVAHAAEDGVVFVSEGRFLEAYALPEGTLRWRQSLAGVALRGLDVAGGDIVLLGLRARPGGEDETFLSAVSLKSGKLVRLREKLEAVDPRYLQLDGGTAYVVSREPDARFAVRAMGLADFATRWEAAAGGGRRFTLLPPALAKDHVVVPCFEQLEGGGYGTSAVLLDKQGRAVQNIRSDGRFERPPEATVANDAVIFSVDSRMEVHR
jgi:hypothetical protein